MEVSLFGCVDAPKRIHTVPDGDLPTGGWYGGYYDILNADRMIDDMLVGIAKDLAGDFVLSFCRFYSQCAVQRRVVDREDSDRETTCWLLQVQKLPYL